MQRVVMIAAQCRGSVIVGKRAQGRILEGLCEFPGGKANSDEPPSVAAVREYREETGIDIPLGSLRKLCVVRFGEIEAHAYATELESFEGLRTTSEHDVLCAVPVKRLLDQGIKWCPVDEPVVGVLIKEATRNGFEVVDA